MRALVLLLFVAVASTACSDRPSDIAGPGEVLFREASAPTADRYEDIAVASLFACALTADGIVDCWSRGSDPERTSSGQDFFTLDALFQHICGLADDGDAWCWGDNGSGQLGDGTTTDRDDPTPVVGGHEFIDVAAGGQFTCALDDGGDAWCWGRGELVVGTAQSSEPRLVTEGRSFDAITAGTSHVCALDGNEAWCWGENGFGQVGDGTTTGRTEPVPVTGGRAFASISAGGSFTCGLEADGDAFCWGHNELTLELGIDDDRVEFVTEPTAVVGDHAFASLSAGSIHACALEGDGDAFCWGEGDEGALGGGVRTQRGRPTPVAGAHTFLVIAAGQHSTCALDTDGDPWCWGLIQSDGNPLVPTPVLPAAGAPTDAHAVRDLEIGSSTATTVRLGWTQVDNGLGEPAWYRVKYTETPLENWKNATIGCRRTLKGNHIGEAFECTVEGLAPGTRYDFQLMSFRIEDGHWAGAVFSNVATGETRSGDPAPVVVRDLEVTDAGSSTLTLRWTQVDDGTGEPARYRVRYGSPLGTWKEGTIGCARNIAGTKIGTEMTCTVDGLAPGVTYDLQLYSFRVEGGQWKNARASNRTSGRTEGG